MYLSLKLRQGPAPGLFQGDGGLDSRSVDQMAGWQDGWICMDMYGYAVPSFEDRFLTLAKEALGNRVSLGIVLDTVRTQYGRSVLGI